MAENKYIIISAYAINGGAQLVVEENCVIQAPSSSTFWGGIEVLGVPTANQSGAQGTRIPGRLYVEDSEIRNARIGVNNGFGASRGGVIQCKKTHFIDNLLSVNMQDYSSPLHIDMSYFHLCEFKKTNNVVGSISGHVTLRDVNGIKFLGCSFYNENTTTDLDNPYSGCAILSFSSGFVLDFYCDNSQSISPCPIIDQVPSYVSGFYNGVMDVDQYSGKRVQISNTIFENNRTGITVFNSIGSQIRNNGIKINHNGTNNRFGINAYNSTYYSIEGNEVYSHDMPAERKYFSYGISSRSSGTLNNEIYYNNVYNVDVHFLALENNRGAVSDGLRYLCNSNSNAVKDNFDFLIQQGNIPLTLNTGISIVQGKPSGVGMRPSGNTFSTKTSPVFGVEHFLNDVISSNLSYYYGPTTAEEPIYYSGINAIDEPVSNNCPTKPTASLSNGSYTEMKGGIIEHIGELADQGAQESTSDQHMEYLNALDSLNEIFKLRAQTLMLAEYDILDSLYDVYSEASAYLPEMFLHMAFHQAHKGSYDLALIDLDKLRNAEIEMFDSEEIDGLAAFLEIHEDLVEANGDTSEVSDFYDRLESVYDNNNHFAKGLAEGMLAQYFNWILEAETATFEEERPSSNTQSVEINSFALYPNPANGNIYLESHDQNEFMEIKIFNFIGQNVHSEFGQNQTLINIDIGSFTKGVYFVQCHFANGNVETLKLIKQ